MSNTDIVLAALDLLESRIRLIPNKTGLGTTT